MLCSKTFVGFKNYYLYPKQASIESKDDFAISHINLFSVKQTKLDPGYTVQESAIPQATFLVFSCPGVFQVPGSVWSGTG